MGRRPRAGGVARQREEKCRKADRTEKGKVLGEAVTVTGYHRKPTVRLVWVPLAVYFRGGRTFR